MEDNSKYDKYMIEIFNFKENRLIEQLEAAFLNVERYLVTIKKKVLNTSKQRNLLMTIQQ